MYVFQVMHVVDIVLVKLTAEFGILTSLVPGCQRAFEGSSGIALKLLDNARQESINVTLLQGLIRQPHCRVDGSRRFHTRERCTFSGAVNSHKFGKELLVGQFFGTLTKGSYFEGFVKGGLQACLLRSRHPFEQWSDIARFQSSLRLQNNRSVHRIAVGEGG